MVLYIIGLGLGDEKDITIRGKEAIEKCNKLYLESYTSLLCCPKEQLEKFHGKKIISAFREDMEQYSDNIIEEAKEDHVAILVVGDPFGATTHSMLLLKAKEEKIKVEIVHNTTIMSAVGCCGLQLYKFGQTISIPYWSEEWKPMSFYEKLKQNYDIKLQTLCLLDIKAREQTVENMMKGNNIYEPPRFMKIHEAIEQLLECEKEMKYGILTKDSLGVGLARVGQSDQDLHYGTLEELSKHDFGRELHSLIIIHPESLDEIEKEYLEKYVNDN